MELIIENNEYLYEREYLEHFKKANKRRMQKSIIEKCNPLLTKKIIEPECVDGQCDFERLHLTDEVQKKLFPEFNIIEMKDTAKELIKHTSFAEKQHNGSGENCRDARRMRHTRHLRGRQLHDHRRHDHRNLHGLLRKVT